MSRKLDYMDLKQILSLQQDGLSNRMIAKTLGVNRNTVNEYMALFKACDVPFDELLTLDEPSIKEKAKEEGAEIHWGDETGARNNSQHGRSYAPKGRTPVKKSSAKRFSINMISTLTNQGKVKFMVYSGTMNSDRLIEFMEQLVKDSDRKIYLILDNLRVHHSKVVKKWEEENKENIALYYLPSYSPEKNPDEYLNCDLKYGLSEKPAPKNQEQLRSNVENHMKMLQKDELRVKKYFRHKDIKYAA
jgi:transposase